MKVAVIGVGMMGRNHARVYSELPEIQLVGVADVNLSRVESVSRQFGTQAYGQYRHLLEKEQPDAVSVVVPTAFHEQVVADCLEAGVHVLVEKPIAATVAEGERLIALANAHNRRLMVGHIVRFNPAVQALKQKLMDGDLGRIFQIFCRRTGPFPAHVRDVGVVVDLAPHDVDLMRFLTGAEPLRVYAETERRVHAQFEDHLFGLLRFPDGVTGALEINWLTPTKTREVLVLGENGMFRVDDLMQDIYYYEHGLDDFAGVDGYHGLVNIKGCGAGGMIRYGLQRHEPLKAELRAFLQSIQQGTPVPVSGEDGLAALRIALALVQSGKENRAIFL